MHYINGLKFKAIDEDEDAWIAAQLERWVDRVQPKPRESEREHTWKGCDHTWSDWLQFEYNPE
jgi:hypothetical protein